MHIRVNSMAIQPANFYAAAQGEAAAARQQASEARRKLARAASRVDTASTPEEALLINQWIGASILEEPGEKETDPSEGGRDWDFA